MKWKRALVWLLAASMAMLSGCFCRHEWVPADCVRPESCTRCQETRAEALGHRWKAASCAAPQTCEVCGETRGEALPHTWQVPTCETAQTCQSCAATQGEPLGHSWLEATYDAPQSCAVCAATQGEALVRADLGLDMEAMTLAVGQALQEAGYALSYLGIDKEGNSVFYLLDSTGIVTGIKVIFEPAKEGTMVYAIALRVQSLEQAHRSQMIAAACAMLARLDGQFDVGGFVRALQEPAQMIDAIPVRRVESQGLFAEEQELADMRRIWIYPSE